MITRLFNSVIMFGLLSARKKNSRGHTSDADGDDEKLRERTQQAPEAFLRHFGTELPSGTERPLLTTALMQQLRCVIHAAFTWRHAKLNPTSPALTSSMHWHRCENYAGSGCHWSSPDSPIVFRARKNCNLEGEPWNGPCANFFIFEIRWERNWATIGPNFLPPPFPPPRPAPPRRRARHLRATQVRKLKKRKRKENS